MPPYLLETYAFLVPPYMAILELSHNQCTASRIENTLRRTIFHGFAVPFYNAKVYAALSFSDTAKSTLSCAGKLQNLAG